MYMFMSSLMTFISGISWRTDFLPNYFAKRQKNKNDESN